MSVAELVTRDPARRQAESAKAVAEVETVAGEEPKRQEDAGHTPAGAAETPAPAAGIGIVVQAAAAGGVVGAIAAVAAVFAIGALNPPLDARVGPLADRLAVVDTRLGQFDEALRTLNTEMAQAIEADAAFGGQIAEQRVEAEALRARVEDAAAGQKLAMGVGSPFFSVAVAQLEAAAASGTPFETELVNVYTLAADDPQVIALLQRLAGPARTGLPSADALRRRLSELAQAAGLPVGDRQTYYDLGASLVGRYVGLSAQPYEVEAAVTAVEAADWALRDGDVTGAATSLSVLEPGFAQALGPWFDTVRERQAAVAAVSELSGIASAALREKMQQDGSQ
ncbi:hypothetical protein [Arenibaculum sp.]|uniref:hypothetical protein n=1 Tax=Arenibaculum sp. TaxID=2865862 RepID=UPI002E125D2D|nr:hypothetical protein [Arenibaculum sp.]